jgi:hypothetical protein
MSPDSTLRRWAGAAIGGGALALAVLVLLGTLIAPRLEIVHEAEARIVSIYRIISCGVWGVPVRGLVTARSADHSVSVVPDALFCKPNDADCIRPVGRADTAGSFDFRVQFHFQSINGISTDKQEEETIVVRAPGCNPQELRVQDQRAPYRVILECPQRSVGPPPAPPLSVGVASPSHT